MVVENRKKRVRQAEIKTKRNELAGGTERNDRENWLGKLDFMI